LSDICFPAGVRISCDQGNILIEKINPRINTINSKKIVGITKTISKEKHLICFEKDSLEKNVPNKQTIMSENHCIFYRNKMVQAKEFVNMFENVYKINYGGEVLYNVLMKEYNKMTVNNLICETLHPKNITAMLYKKLQTLNPEEQEELINYYNERYVVNDETS
jgi:hypothetical protein